MTTNTHILALNDRLTAARTLVCALSEDTDKQPIIDLLNEAIDHLMEANTDMSNAVRKVVMLSDQLTILNHRIYEPVISGQMAFPAEGDYNAVREYVEQRRAHDEVFKRYCNTHKRSELCNRLSDEFGWVVDVKSYARNVQRHY